MSESSPRKSPRAPSIPLKEAIERALKVYDRERLHEAPIEIIAQHIGYKNANSGTALSAIASLRYFGLLVRPKNGFLAVAKELESLKFAPSATQKQELLIQFLKKPPLYAELLAKYATGLPSEASLKYELIQRNFIPAAAETAQTAFLQSVAFVDYFNAKIETDNDLDDTLPEPEIDAIPEPVIAAKTIATPPLASEPPENKDPTLDTIPVRLPGGRRAWLQIPTPFYKADKLRIKAQIDLLLAEDEDL